MATSAADTPRVEADGNIVALGIVASDKIWQGSALGWSSGYVRPLVSGDAFAGFSHETKDNSDGAAGDISVLTKRFGNLKLPVTGAAVGDEGQSVYATDDLTFTTVQGGSRIGCILRVESSGVAVVKLEPTDLERNLLAGNVPDSATFVVGSEGSNAITVTGQLKDASGQDLAAAACLMGYLSSDAAGQVIEPVSATLTITHGEGAGDGSVHCFGAANADGHHSFQIVSEADGDFAVKVTQTSGADTHYLNLVMPNGKIVTSEAITFA